MYALGGALASTLIQCEHLSDIRATLVMRDLPNLIERSISQIDDKLKTINQEDDTDGLREKLDKWRGILAMSLLIVTGAEVKDYVEDFFI